MPPSPGTLLPVLQGQAKRVRKVVVLSRKQIAGPSRKRCTKPPQPPESICTDLGKDPALRLIALTAATLALPTIAFAETPAPAEAPALSFSGSVTIASRYVSDGIEYSTGAVVQPYVEMGYAGFYAGVWATNAEEDLLGADAEVDFNLGYRGTAGTFYYDIGYGYYTYPGASEFNSGEVLVSGGVGVQETVYLTAAFAYSSEFDTLDKSLRVDYYTPVTGLAVAAVYGNNDSWNYWTAGASYAFNETFSADVTWHQTDLDDVDGLFVFGLTTSF